MSTYHSVYFQFDRRRSSVWKEIARYLQRYIPREGTLLELGGGYCDFVNNIEAAKKYVVDVFDEIDHYAGKEVTVLKQSAETLEGIDDASMDTVFASNFFEHLNKNGFERCLGEVRRALKPGGRLIVIQPNYRFCAASYFDDYTHSLIFSHVTMRDWLRTLEFEPELVVPRFLPFSMKSRLPKSGLLVKIYLRLPFRPLAKQFLVVAAKKRSSAAG